MEFNWATENKYDFINNPDEAGQHQRVKMESHCSTDVMTCFDLVDAQELLEYREMQSLMIPSQIHFDYPALDSRQNEQQLE